MAQALRVNRKQEGLAGPHHAYNIICFIQDRFSDSSGAVCAVGKNPVDFSGIGHKTIHFLCDRCQMIHGKIGQRGFELAELLPCEFGNHAFGGPA